MTRSRLLNAGIGLLGLLFIAAGGTFLTEDVSWAGWKGVFNAHALLLGVMNLCLGAWCAYGSYRNFLSIPTSPRRPLSPAERAARIDAFVIAVSIVILARTELLQESSV